MAQIHERNLEGSRRPPPGDQTFDPEHYDRLFDLFAGAAPTEELGMLFRASYSRTFAADLRELIRQIVKPEYIDEWEGGGP